MDEIPGAKLKHAMLALFVGMYACAGEDPDSCGVEFVGGKPFLKVNIGNMKDDDKKFYDNCFKCFEKMAD